MQKNKNVRICEFQCSEIAIIPQNLNTLCEFKTYINKTNI